MTLFLEAAPWATKVEAEAVGNTALRLQIEDQYKPEDERRIQPKHWVQEEN